MKNRNKKNIYLVLSTAVIICIIICIVGTYFLQGFANPSYSSTVSCKIFNAFYNEEKNSLDAVYIGPSAVNRYWIPPLAFENQGIAISVFSTPEQPFVLAKYMMQEAKKSQDSALYIVELITACKDANYTTEKSLRYTTDNLKPSLLRLKAVNAGLENMSLGENEVQGNSIATFFPALEPLKRMLKGNLDEKINFRMTEEENPVKGYRMDSTLTFRQTELPVSQYTPDKTAPMAPETEEILLDLLDYCDSIDNEVVFVLAPYSAKEDDYPILNTAISIVESRGYDVINFNTKESIESLGINWKTDFYNRVHTNCLGAEKFTLSFAEYLKENYNLPDHRNDPTYSDWHESYSNYVDYTAERKEKMIVE